MSAPPAAPYLDQIVEHCQNARFTGLLRMRSRQGEGELWFLSGIRDDARFGVSHGDEAMQRMARANEPTFELVPRLPPPTPGSKKSYPLEGPLGELRPVDLMRLCETNAITCTLELSQGDTRAVARYQVGELLTVESESADASAIGAMLEWSEGNYRFELPPLELPPGVPAYAPPAAPLIEQLVAQRASSDKEAAAKRLAEEEAAKRRAEAEALAKRRAAEEEAERRRVEEAAAAKRREEEAAAKRRAEEAAAAKARDQEAAAKRRTEEEAAAAKRRAEAEAEAKRKAEEEAARQRAAEEAIRKKAVSVHRQIVVGGGSHPPKALSEPPRPAPRAAAEKPAAELFAPKTEADRRIDEIADAWRKAEEAAEAKVRASSRPPPPVEPQPSPPAPEPVAEKEPSPPPPVTGAPEPVAQEEPSPPPPVAAKQPEPEAVRVERRPRAKLGSIPSEPPPRKRSLWPLVILVLVVVAAVAYFYGTR